MSSFFIIMKIKDYLPKIDYIPFYNYTCIISCNNVFARIKLINKNLDFFESKVYVIDNCDMIFKIKLIDEINHNFLIGDYNLIIPFQKLSQMIKRSSSLYQRQIKLNMNPNIRMNSIYLDLVIEIFLDKKIPNQLYQNYVQGVNKSANKYINNNFYNNIDYNKKMRYLRLPKTQDLNFYNDEEDMDEIPNMKNILKEKSTKINVNYIHNLKNYNTNIHYYESQSNNFNQYKNMENDIEKNELNRKRFYEKSSFYRRIFNNSNILNTTPNHAPKNYSLNGIVQNNKSVIKYNNNLLRSPFNYSVYNASTSKKKYVHPKIKKSNNNKVVIFWNYPNNTKIIKQNLPNRYNFNNKYNNNYLSSNIVKNSPLKEYVLNTNKPKLYKSNKSIFNNNENDNFKTNNTNIIINNINMTNRTCAKSDIKKKVSTPKIKINSYLSKKCNGNNPISRNKIQNLKNNIKKITNLSSLKNIDNFCLNENNNNNKTNTNELVTNTKRSIINVSNNQEELLNNIFTLL